MRLLLGYLIIFLFFFGNFQAVENVFALDASDAQSSHGFVSMAVKGVAPAVVRIDTERTIDHQAFDQPRYHFRVQAHYYYDYILCMLSCIHYVHAH